MNKQREFIEWAIKFIAEEKAAEKKEQPGVETASNAWMSSSVPAWMERYWTLKPLHASQNDRRRV